MPMARRRAGSVPSVRSTGRRPRFRPPVDDRRCPAVQRENGPAERLPGVIEQVDAVSMRGSGNASMSLAGRPLREIASRMASAVAFHNSSMSRSIWRAFGMNCVTRRRAAASGVPSISKMTALVTVRPLSIPSSVGIQVYLTRATGPRRQERPPAPLAMTTLISLDRMRSICTGWVFSSTMTTSNSSSAAKLWSARRSNLV